MEVIKEKVSRVTSRFLTHTTGWMGILTGAEDIKPSSCYGLEVHEFIFGYIKFEVLLTYLQGGVK